jgi:large subunit ribosomal protein L23
MTDPYQVIIRPLLTEKSVANVVRKKYTFQVALGANKVQIARAVEALFNGTKVAGVNTMHVRGKERRMSGYGRRRRRPGRTTAWKKAIVTLREGTIPVFEGL